MIKRAAAGIGKTTLAQHVKHLLSRDGYVVRWRPVAVTAGQRSAALLVDILASVHESVITAHPQLADKEPFEAARGLVRSYLRQVGMRGRSKVYALTGTGIIALGLAGE